MKFSMSKYIAIIISVIFLSTSLCYADPDTNTDDLIGQQELIRSIENELSVIRELIILHKQMQKNQGLIDTNLSELISQNELMGSISEEIKAISIRLKIIKQEKENKELMLANIQSIMLQTEKIAMLLRELKAMNMIVFAKTDLVNVDVQPGQVFNIVLTAKNIKSGVTAYTVEYNQNEIEAVDLCSITQEEELEELPVTVGDIYVTEHTISDGKGTIKFTFTKELPEGQTWSGIISGIKFKGTIAGDTTIRTKIN